MKKGLLALGLLVFSLPFLVWAVPVEREKQWKNVDEAMKKGLPRTAIDALEPIIAGALKDKAYPEAIKAITRKIALEGNIQGNKPEEKITRMKAVMAKLPAEMMPVMDTLLANWYWHYFQQNRWRFMQRTATAIAPGEDFTTWDLPRIFTEIDKQFTRALAADKLLKTIPIAQYDELLEKGNVPDTYRPTLYDFLAHNALAFYSSGEQAAAQVQDAFELPAGSPVLGTADEFVKWKIESTDSESRVVKALRIYQELLKFHEPDQDKTAYLDADLLRLHFGYNKAFGEDKNKRYKTVLQKFVEKWGNNETTARALYQWAAVLHTEGDLIQALALAQQGERAFPDSIGGRMCHNLIQQIEAKSFSVTTERVWNNPMPTLDVRYRNIAKIHFRAVPYDFVSRIPTQNYRPEWLNDAERKALIGMKPAKEWSAELPATDDYHERLQRLPAPKDLKPGFYYVIASADANFSGGEGNMVTFTDMWVSNLALVVRSHQGDGILEGFVLDALSGEPISGAEVRSWYRAQNNARVAVAPIKTDANGLFRITGVHNHNYLLLAKHKDQELASANDFYLYKNDYHIKPYVRTVFFTDRSLYRPGQTVQYQGICLQVNQDNDDYKVLGNQNLTVIFADRNNKEVARHPHRSNDFGSFSGSFTAPNDRVTGRMTIRVEGEPNGATAISVEEYKRPKFQVTLDKPTTAAKLNGLVGLQGKAIAYTGAAVDGAKVRYRVVRQVRYPAWWGWHYWWRAPRQTSQEIAHGFGTTEVDGTFKIAFQAKPDVAVPEKDEPTFHYVVHADVTDHSGETRSGQIGINVGYTALKADLIASNWQTSDKDVEISVRTITLDEEGQTAEGVLKVYRLKQPERVYRPELQRQQFISFGRNKDKEPEPDLSNPNSWALGEVVYDKGVTTDKEGNAKVALKLGVGAYRAILETQDRFGKKVTAKLPVQVIDPKANNLAIKVPHILTAPEWMLEPGQEFKAVWGSGYDGARAYVEIEHRNKILQGYWTKPGQTQAGIDQSVTEAMRGGFTLRVTMVRENRAYLESRRVDVPWTNKTFKVRWEHFVSKLEPGQKTTWTAVVTGPDAKRAAAELVATLYDSSLDAFLPHRWMKSFDVFRQDYSRMYSQFENNLHHLQYLQGRWPTNMKATQWTYRSFPGDLAGNFWGYEYFERGAMRQNRAGEPGFAAGRAPMDANGLAENESDRALKADGKSEQQAAQVGGQGPPPAPDLGKVTPRKNLSETAFFFPTLVTDKDGEVKLQFTMPEALTQWKFMGFAHDKALRGGLLEGTAVTARELMVQPYAPRFLREGDALEFTVKVVNQSDKRQSGSVQLAMSDARTGKSVDALLGNINNDKTFEIPAKESRTFSWRLKVPDDMGFLSYKAVGSTGQISDGEEGYLPVLSRRVLVTESLPLPIRGPITKTFDFARLRKSGESTSIKNKQLTVQMVSQPTWYAVMALPYLMEYPYQCTEQTFNRLYANSLARHIANSDPKIKKVFELWRGTPALDSPLEKNQDLRAVMLEETPWVRQAQAESQARRNVGILFDDNRLNHETASLLRQLAELQHPDGAWPWFPGGPANDYITLYITTGFGRMRHLGVNIDTVPAVKSLSRLDGWIDQTYQHIVRVGAKNQNNLSPTIALYLYGRSFFLKDRLVDPKHQEAVNYFLDQAKTHWLKLANRQSQAHLALALHRFNTALAPGGRGRGEGEAAQGIMRSIKERAVTNEEMGMFWRDLELSWWWFRAPIETQAMMIEAFDEVMNDAKAVEECKVWLLKQKQTQDWKTTKATADAVYALLLRGTGALASDALVEVTVGGFAIVPEKVEAGTAFYEKRFQGGDIKPEMGNITVKKTDEGVSWGSVTWQYLEDVNKITPYEGTPLKLKKVLYTRTYTKKGPVLEPVVGALKVGDELVVRLELRVDRDMEYVHLKDARGSGTEPVNVLSRYRYQDGLAYYESTRDTASHFFIDYLPKGTYVFEYATRVVHRGQYQTGMAQIQSMYAPEFNSHSESIALDVQ